MKCKDCGKEIAGDEYRKVADWMFCLECFEKLMEPSEKKAETETADQAEPIEPLHIAKHVCQMCNKEIEIGQEKTIGVWTLCDHCHADLVFQPPKPAAPKDLPEEDDDALREETAGPDGLPSGRVKIDMTKTIDCHGCGRPIREVAGREVDGNLFCPECFYAMPEQIVIDVKAELRHPEKTPDKAAPKESPAATARKKEKKCESCERDLVEGNFDTVEGFVICRACLATDPDLAVNVARRRHQEYLQKLKDGRES